MAETASASTPPAEAKQNFRSGRHQRLNPSLPANRLTERTFPERGDRQPDELPVGSDLPWGNLKGKSVRQREGPLVDASVSTSSPRANSASRLGGGRFWPWPEKARSPCVLNSRRQRRTSRGSISRARATSFTDSPAALRRSGRQLELLAELPTKSLHCSSFSFRPTKGVNWLSQILGPLLTAPPWATILRPSGAGPAVTNEYWG